MLLNCVPIITACLLKKSLLIIKICKAIEIQPHLPRNIHIKLITNAKIVM